MTSTRIVLPSRHKPFAEDLLQVTGIDSLSNLFVILLTRYGSHLKASWNISQTITETITQPSITTATTPPITTAKIYNFPEPQTQETEVDPLIARIAGLVDLF
ncbi:hypothetical protein NIES2101_24015 [Calothrix sp. HK-06]|nr:hypothetical protein NIES2101_23880 [Calothrix sp. HK-06]OKH47334.1 hypothetical protein NIES2101_24015 [Calothrix sp. HK-06]